MVGSGFSRACLRESSSPAPPLWGDFKARMEIALGYSSAYAPDALRLAQEYQTLHGEDGLDRLIRELVPDERWSPGPLHKRLLELPWQDVLTTNWDTLLERTTLETPDRVYSCVRTVQDIAHQAAPRIIKLHGSLPSHKPFKTTEKLNITRGLALSSIFEPPFEPPQNVRCSDLICSALLPV